MLFLKSLSNLKIKMKIEHLILLLPPPQYFFELPAPPVSTPKSLIQIALVHATKKS